VYSDNIVVIANPKTPIVPADFGFNLFLKIPKTKNIKSGIKGIKTV